MSELKVTGKITTILDVEKGVSKADKEWHKVFFVIDTGAKFNPEVCFQIFGQEKVDKFLKYNKVGDDVDVDFNLSSREYNGKYFHNLDAWKVFKAGESTDNTPTPEPVDETNSLPF